jgi:hypothetical protein
MRSDHVSEQQRREDLGDGADFKLSVAIDESRIILVKMATRDNSAILGSNDTDHDANTVLLTSESLNSRGENLMNSCV